MRDFLDFLKAFLKGFFELTPKVIPQEPKETTSWNDFDNSPHLSDLAYDFGKFYAETLRLGIVQFMENTPLTHIDGSINQEWAEQFALGFPECNKEDVQEGLHLLKHEQDWFIELYLSGKEDELPAESLLDKTIASIAPQIRFLPETNDMRIMVHNQWLLYVPGLITPGAIKGRGHVC